jgi:hypothetical protein
MYLNGEEKSDCLHDTGALGYTSLLIHKSQPYTKIRFTRNKRRLSGTSLDLNGHGGFWQCSNLPPKCFGGSQLTTVHVTESRGMSHHSIRPAFQREHNGSGTILVSLRLDAPPQR